MNDNELGMTPFWARSFRGQSPESLKAALGVLAGLINDPDIFLRLSRAVRSRLLAEGVIVMPAAVVLAEVSEKHEIPVSTIKGQRRSLNIIAARREACWRLRKELGLSYPRIGTIMGNRDHSTIISSVRKHSRWLESLQ